MAKKGGKYSRDKGKRGEREVARALSELFGVEVKRSQQYTGAMGHGDVFGIEGLHFECKFVERLNVWSAIEQAESDSLEGDIPVVCFRRKRTPWYAMVALEDLPSLITILHDTIVENLERKDTAPQQNPEGKLIAPKWGDRGLIPLHLIIKAKREEKARRDEELKGMIRYGQKPHHRMRKRAWKIRKPRPRSEE